MKENQKLLREVLKDIRHDMTDDEVLNLLADSKKSNPRWGSAPPTRTDPQSLRRGGSSVLRQLK